MIKVIDIFAGPGGLGEGFTSKVDVSKRRVFDVALSIEKDRTASETLLLRTFLREFHGDLPSQYYDVLRGRMSLSQLYDAFPMEHTAASAKTWCAQLGPGGVSNADVKSMVASSLSGDEDWVLLGGPPCQAYSLIGRARNRGNPDYDPSGDGRQRLYVEYLQILADHAPAVFIMENVKGLLSASLNDAGLFSTILSDLKRPAAAISREGRVRPKRSPKYRVFALGTGAELSEENRGECVVRAELYGVPQARHRVILLGVREGFMDTPPIPLKRSSAVTVGDVFHGLPHLRSGLSDQVDSDSAWMKTIHAGRHSRWANVGAHRHGGDVLVDAIQRAIGSVSVPPMGRGGQFVPGDVRPGSLASWLYDRRIGGATNHSTRSHMTHDLWRYLYASTFAGLNGRTPSLSEFPTDLVPAHISAARAIESGAHFSDRFRVRLRDRPSTTVVSHISKDGHYYIHPDPAQCRSLTVREAARLQTFPDNYFFCGPRTSQYVQVGNAVPPLLARKIADVVARFFGVS